MLQAEYDYEMDIEVQREEAFEDGIFKGIVSTYKEFQISQMEAIQKLKRSYGISQEEATGYVQKYW